MSTKERLDVLLVNRGLFESREKAKTAIMPAKFLWALSVSTKRVLRCRLMRI